MKMSEVVPIAAKNTKAVLFHARVSCALVVTRPQYWECHQQKRQCDRWGIQYDRMSEEFLGDIFFVLFGARLVCDFLFLGTPNIFEHLWCQRSSVRPVNCRRAVLADFKAFVQATTTAWALRAVVKESGTKNTDGAEEKSHPESFFSFHPSRRDRASDESAANPIHDQNKPQHHESP